MNKNKDILKAYQSVKTAMKENLTTHEEYFQLLIFISAEILSGSYNLSISEALQNAKIFNLELAELLSRLK
ncbi:MAG: hypothetical protein PHY16_16530 [Methylobacter sp.]|nr:hypothetical protein [Methylobacter sp.]